MTEVVVTGFRKSLQDSTNAKRADTGFSDAIFAEDTGKFPDTNVAESFNRVPGIQIVRDATGEGLNVAIRGLGSDFTKVLLNGAPVAVASTGGIDAQNANREVDLNMFPTELFTQLSVKKSADAAMIEGGASGTVDMRQARPFDHPGAHVTFNIEGTNNDLAGAFGERGSLIASDTWGNFGALIGYVGQHAPSRTTGFETVGWTTPLLSTPNPNATPPITTANAQCIPGGGVSCNALGGGNFSIPATVPATARGLPAGFPATTPITQQALLNLNPGLTIQQINNALIPRLGRTMDETGTRDRDNVALSLEARPTDWMNVYVDSIWGRESNDLQRADIDLVGRNGAIIPENLQVDSNNVVTSGTFANSQFVLEYRPYKESTNFWSVNPGIEFQFSDDWRGDIRGNKTHSTFHREVPSLLAATAPGAIVTYTNNGDIPTISSDVDLNNPANFMWNGAARVNIQDERRVTDTSGVRFNVTWGKDGGPLNVNVGAAYDDVSRSIMALDNSGAWQNAVCGGNPSVDLPGPNSAPPCQGLTAAQIAAAPAGTYPTYPGFGKGFTAGQTGSVTYAGSTITNSQLQGFLAPSKDGFVTLNWPAFAAASNYAAFHDAEGAATSSNTGVNGGTIDEKTLGAYGQLAGAFDVSDHKLRYVVGVRWVQTKEIVGAAVSVPNSANTDLLNREIVALGLDPTSSKDVATATAQLQGAFFPNAVSLNAFNQTYYNVLPAGELAFNMADNAVAKLALSKTMTRPDPSALLPGVGFSDPSAAAGNEGNPSLKPYLSQNIDLGVEYYLGGPSYWSLTGFRKRITGFTANDNISLPFNSPILANSGITFGTLSPTQQAQISTRCPQGVTDPTCLVVLTQQQNASGALTINGLELNWVQSFDRFFDHYGWNKLDGFGFAFNFTLIDQFGTGAAPAVALGVAPHSYNLSFYYEKESFSARISTVYNAGSQVSGLNQNGIPLAALFSDDYQQWDFSSYVDLPKLFHLSYHNPLQLTFDVTNLTRATQRSYFEFSNVTNAEYNAGRTYMFGIRGQF